MRKANRFWKEYLLIKPFERMLKTITMSGSRFELPIDIGIEKEKIENRIIDKNAFNDWYAAAFSEIALTADIMNEEAILLSDYTADHQETTVNSVDYIALKPWASIVIPRNRQITALNRIMACGTEGDLLMIAAR